MIERLSIRNFKVLREVDVELKPLTVIVGPNASGKSSILQAISLFLNPSKKDLSLLRSKAAQGGPNFKAVVDGIEYKLDLSTWSSRFVRATPSWTSILLDLDPRKLSAPSYPQDVTLSLPSDGEGLSSLLEGLKLERPDLFSQITDRLRSVVPNIKDVGIRRVPLKPGKVGYEIVFDMVGADGIPAKAASHGTLLTLGVLAALAVHVGSQVVLIDDLDRGLHPKAMLSFLQQLRGLQDSQLQIVATSHSPYLLDHFQAEEVLLTSLGSDGYSNVKSLADHPEYGRWKGYMATGEFWSSVGEDWVTESLPGNRRRVRAR